MSLSLLGWVLIGAVLTGALYYFWDDIRQWLNNTAANAVGKLLGYNARQNMIRAVCVVDRVMNNLHTRSYVYYKRNRLDTYLDKVTLEADAPVSEFDDEVLREINNKGQLIQEFGYRG